MMSDQKSVLLCIVIVFNLITSSALASPWTVPRDELVLTLGYDFQVANAEYLGDGTKQAYPLNGQFSSSTLLLDARYGFTPKFEGGVRFSFKQASYTSDPLLDRLADDPMDLPSTRARIQNFSDTSVGLADLNLFGRYNLHRSWWLATIEVLAKIPPGYDEPTGVNVTLGDAQIDLQPSLLLGMFIPQTFTFGRADVGYNARLGGPGHQLTGGLKIGQFLGKSFILYAGASFAQTLFEGDSFGDNLVIDDPSQPAETLDPSSITVIPLSLDRSFQRLEFGGIVRFKGLELQIGYSTILGGKNIGALHSVNIASVVTIPNATAPTSIASSK